MTDKRAAVDPSHSGWLDFLEQLCAIDSRTIDGAEGTIRVGELFGERLDSLGFELQWHDTLPEEGQRGRHLVAVRNPQAAVRLVLIGHTDTVLSPDDVPFVRPDSSGRFHGSGVCDMKGSDVLLIESLAVVLDRSAAVCEAGLIVTFNCTEEIAGPSFRKLIRELAAGAKACLGYEPARYGPNGEHQIVVSRKGVIRSELKCFGRAAHSGNSHPEGVSAIRELARKIEQIESLTDYDRELTANVGIIHGGRAVNQVAEEATARFDLRAYEPDVLEGAYQAAQKICEASTLQSKASGHTTRSELKSYRSYPPWPRSAGGDALAEQYIAFAEKHGITATAIKSGGGADACNVADIAPTIDGLGILGGAMHRRDEWADANSFMARVQVSADLIESLCEAEPTG